MSSPPPGAASGPPLRWPAELLYWDSPGTAFQPSRSVLITNNPLAAGLFYGARTAGNAAGRRRARQAGRPQWLAAGTGEVALDERGLTLTGNWGGQAAEIRVDHGEVSGWHREADALKLAVVGYYPLLIRTAGIAELAGAWDRLSRGRLWQPLNTERWAPPPQVRLAGWEQRDRRFTFSVPAGWAPLTDPGYLSRVAADAANNQQRLLFMLQRDPAQGHATVDVNEITDREIIQLLSGDPGHLEQDALRFAGVKARNAAGEVVRRPRVVLLDGERAVLVDTTMNTQYQRVRLGELYAGHQGHWLMIGLAVADPADPLPRFAQAALEFQAMIATWQWRF